MAAAAAATGALPALARGVGGVRDSGGARLAHPLPAQAIPTHDDLTCVVVGWPPSQFKENRKDVEGSYMKSFELAPEFAERIHGAKRETRFVGTADLVGDAGYHKHPITAFGITDAFRDAEAVASAVDDAFAGRRPYDDAMADYQQARDEAALPIYEFTNEFAKIEPLRPRCSSS